MSATEILEAARVMPLRERVELVQQLWDDITDDGYDPAITAEQASELERRLAEHRANPGDLVPWEQIKAESEANQSRGR